jgi:hypothetical protein
MATGKTLVLREIKPKKYYPEKAGNLRILADGTMYQINGGKGWRYLGTEKSLLAQETI